ncbi:MAG: hypothetical protein LBF27_25555 [Sphingobacterium sp.]|jgi:hypothetical protein|nr:hypothetical protein [Sphingobacterium sp.]
MDTSIVDNPNVDTLDQAEPVVSDYKSITSKLDEKQQMSLEKEIASFAISMLYNKKPKDIAVELDNGIYHGKYVGNEGNVISTKIKFNGTNLEWGNSDGRWRDTNYDDKLSYNLGSGMVTINVTYSDGSGTSKNFESKVLHK